MSYHQRPESQRNCSAPMKFEDLGNTIRIYCDECGWHEESPKRITGTKRAAIPDPDSERKERAWEAWRDSHAHIAATTTLDQLWWHIGRVSIIEELCPQWIDEFKQRLERENGKEEKA